MTLFNGFIILIALITYFGVLLGLSWLFGRTKTKKPKRHLRIVGKDE